MAWITVIATEVQQSALSRSRYRSFAISKGALKPTRHLPGRFMRHLAVRISTKWPAIAAAAAMAGDTRCVRPLKP